MSIILDFGNSVASVRTPLVRLEIRIIIIDHMSTIRNNENSLNKTKNHTIKEYYYT